MYTIAYSTIAAHREEFLDSQDCLLQSTFAEEGADFFKGKITKGATPIPFGTGTFYHCCYLNKSIKRAQNPFSSSSAASVGSCSSCSMLAVFNTNCTEFTFSFSSETKDIASKSDLS